MTALHGESTFLKHIDSSVRYGGGLWFSSGIWAIKISTDGERIDRDCRHFWCPNYWDAVEKNRDIFNKGFDSVAWAPGTENCFWIFGADQCMRVTEDGKTAREGPGEILDIWPKLKGSDFGSPIAACTYIAGSSPPQYLFFNKERSDESSKHLVLTYTRTANITEHKVEGPVPVVEKFPSLANYPKFVNNLSSCLDDSNGGYWFFSENQTCRCTKEGDLKPAPGGIGQHWSAFELAQCKEKCDQ